MVALVAAVLVPNQRPAAARRIAHQLGGEDLLIFLRDPEIGQFLPAPGFPQTLAHGRPGQDFLESVATSGPGQTMLAYRPNELPETVLGFRLAEDAVLAVVGGHPQPALLDPALLLLPFLVATLRLEQSAAVAHGQLAAARQAVVDAEARTQTLDQARQDLRQALAEREEAERRLTLLMQTRDEFLGSAAHDLKNPLSAIKGITQVLIRRLAREPGSVETWLVDGLRTVDQTTTRITHQIDELLDLARLPTGEHLAVDCLPVDLVPLVQRVTAALQQTTETHRIRVQTELASLVGSWDAARLERALGNLLTNAVKYSPAGGDIIVRIGECRSATTEWYAVVEIKDQGIGIPAADLPYILDRFYRAENARGRVTGTGIGLASVRQIVEAHGGTITIESVEGAGSTFRLLLPIGH